MPIDRPPPQAPDAGSAGLFQAVPHGVADAVVVSMSGELDLASADLADQELSAAAARKPACVVADLTNVSLLDSTGLGILIEAARVSEQGTFALICPGGLHARGVLSISGALDHLIVFESEDDLRRHLGDFGRRTGP